MAMIKQVIRLIKPGLFLPCFVNEPYKAGNLLIRPKILSICAADQRYFNGNRPAEVLRKKLPLALFHEALGQVLYDPMKLLSIGSYCILLPGGMESLDENSNYKQGAYFRSSNADGFCQEVLSMRREEVIPIDDNNADIYIFTELMSVCCQALRKIEEIKIIDGNAEVGIWGDGALAYLMATVLKAKRSNCCINIFGKHDDKLANFSFVDKCINVADLKNSTKVDFAIECVGGKNSECAISQALEKINPLGMLVLMGVSESGIVFPTRTILEKGLTIIGTSRSTKRDFLEAYKIINDINIQNSLLKIISKRVGVSNASEMMDVFSEEINAPYKYLIDLNL